MTDSYIQFGQIISSVLGARKLPDVQYDWMFLSGVFAKQNLIPILYSAISRTESIDCKPASDLVGKLYYQNLRCLSVQVNQQHEIEVIKNLFEKNGIYNLFLKGSIIQNRYPDSLLRTMGDIDFLYKPEQHSLLKKMLIENGFDRFQEGRKNDIYRNNRNVILEAHRQLVPSESSFFSWCERVWERAVQSSDMKYSYEMKIEDEIIYSIIHMAIHFLEGGAGVRFLCDLYVYKKMECDWTYVRKELESLKLLVFFEKMSDLVDKWFSLEGIVDHSYDKIIEYIVNGGVFGRYENATALHTEKGGANYLKSNWFPSYKEMCSLYPWLDGKPILLPFAWIKRGFVAVFVKKRSVKKSIQVYQSADKEKSKRIRELYEEYGLSMALRE